MPGRVLVVGDRILDEYVMCRATRLCPESPAPVLHIESQYTAEGGASLVHANLSSLLGSESVDFLFGSLSLKKRIFADRTLICRIDQDGIEQYDISQDLDAAIKSADLVVVSDYGKGALTSPVISALKSSGKPLFVDSKHNLSAYSGCFAAFPNEHESTGSHQHVIRKRGSLGCSVDNVPVPTREQQVYDVTGAGDVFLAAFVVQYALGEHDLMVCAEYANRAAGISVRHLGTYIVKPEELA